MDGDGSLDPPTHPEEGGNTKVRSRNRSPAGAG